MKHLLRIVLLMGAASPAWAHGTGTAAASFLQQSPNPRAMAMGEAQVGLADDVYAAHWNPAGLALLQTPEGGFVHSESILDIRSEYAAYAHPHAAWGTFAGSLTHVSFGPIDAFDAVGQPLGTTSASDTAVGIHYARSWTESKRSRPAMAIGLTGKWIQERLDRESANALAADVGLLLTPGRWYGTFAEGLRAGIVMRNLGSNLRFDGDSAPLPLSLAAGLSWTGHWLGEMLTVTADGQKPREGRTSAGAGLELSSLRLLMLRAGYTTHAELGSGLRLGLGIRLRTLQLDYAIAHFGPWGAQHRVGATLRFGIAPADPLVLAEASFAKGMKAFRQNRYAEALVLFNKTLEINSAHPEAYRLMKETYEKLKSDFPH